MTSDTCLALQQLQLEEAHPAKHSTAECRSVLPLEKSPYAIGPRHDTYDERDVHWRFDVTIVAHETGVEICSVGDAAEKETDCGSYMRFSADFGWFQIC